jgi:hypothetical protein
MHTASFALPFDLLARAQVAVERIESSTYDEIRLSTFLKEEPFNP